MQEIYFFWHNLFVAMRNCLFLSKNFFCHEKTFYRDNFFSWQNFLSWHNFLSWQNHKTFFLHQKVLPFLSLWQIYRVFFPKIFSQKCTVQKMAAFGRCLFKKIMRSYCQVFVNSHKNVTPQSVCLACKYLAAFHEQAKVQFQHRLQTTTQKMQIQKHIKAAGQTQPKHVLEVGLGRQSHLQIG